MFTHKRPSPPTESMHHTSPTAAFKRMRISESPYTFALPFTPLHSTQASACTFTTPPQTPQTPQTPTVPVIHTESLQSVQSQANGIQPIQLTGIQETPSLLYTTQIPQIQTTSQTLPYTDTVPQIQTQTLPYTDTIPQTQNETLTQQVPKSPKRTYEDIDMDVDIPSIPDSSDTQQKEEQKQLIPHSRRMRIPQEYINILLQNYHHFKQNMDAGTQVVRYHDDKIIQDLKRTGTIPVELAKKFEKELRNMMASRKGSPRYEAQPNIQIIEIEDEASEANGPMAENAEVEPIPYIESYDVTDRADDALSDVAMDQD